MYFSLWQFAGIMALIAFLLGASLTRLLIVLALVGVAFLLKKWVEASKADVPHWFSEKVCHLPKPSSEKDLQELLENGGISTAVFGTGNAKPLSSLLRELLEGECALDRGKLTGRITRTCEPVFVVLHYDGKVLVETAQVLPDGRHRDRFMVLAEKRKPIDSSPVQAAIRGVSEELGLGSETALPSCIGHCQDKDACFFEEIDSASYPGLPCVYQNHQIHLEISVEDDAALQLLSSCGLPHCSPFETVEERPNGLLRHHWAWVDIQDAQKRKAKGMHFCLI